MAALNRITGIPGAGKTERLKRHVEAWHRQDGISADRIVCTSFTKTAAQVLRGRLPIPAGNASTLHSLAYRALGSMPIAEADASLVEDWNGQHHGATWQVKASRKVEALEDTAETMAFGPSSEQGAELAAYTLWRATGRTSKRLETQTKAFAAAWEDYKRQTHSIDFQDMIDYALRDADHCPGDPDCFVVDEAQDLNPTQWALALKWGQAAAHRFVAAGDPAQTLYQFTGATPETLLAPLPAGGQDVLLGHSWRCPPAVLKHAETWLRQHSGSMCEGRNVTADDNKVGWVDSCAATWADPAELVRALRRHSQAGETCAVLGSYSYLLGPTIAALRDAGVPFWNPYRLHNTAWNPLHHREGTTSSVQRLQCWFEGRPTGAHAVTALENLPARYFVGSRKAALARLTAMPTVESLEGILQPEGAHAWVEADGAWYANAHGTESQRKALRFALNLFLADPEAFDADPRVIVGTIHSIKGGQAEHIYLLPDLTARVREAASFDRDQRDAVIRTWYVGITRAQVAVHECEPDNYRNCIEAL